MGGLWKNFSIMCRLDVRKIILEIGCKGEVIELLGGEREEGIEWVYI